MIPEGSTTLHYYSRDSLGNRETVLSQPINVDLTSPSSPAAASAAAESTTTISVGWQPSTDAGAGVDRYLVIETSTTAVVATASATATNAVVANLTPDTAYSFRVVAVDTAGNVSSPSGNVGATTFPPDTSPPITTAILTPLSADGENGWFITVPKIRLTANEPGTIFWNWDSTTPDAYTGPIDGLLGDHNLSYYAVDLAGNTEVANDMHLLVDNVAPTAPSALEVTITGPTTMRLTWDASSDGGSGLAGYRVYGGTGAVIATVTADETTYTATVPVGKLQSFFVRAFDVAGKVSKRSNTVNKKIPRGAYSSGRATPSTVNENAPAYGRSTFTYSDLQDTGDKYEGGYAVFDDTSTAQYTVSPHGGYDSSSNKCQVCHAVHRARARTT